MSFKDESGKRYGLLTVDHFWKIDGSRGAVWICRCDCGAEVAVLGTQLRSGNNRSCGCLRRMPFDERKKLGFWSGRK